MYLHNIELTQFRNYDYIELILDEKKNLLLGNNGSGKTNLLEAIYYLSLGKSFRGVRDEILIQVEEDYFRIKGESESKFRGRQIAEIAYQKESRKKIKIDGKEKHKLSELIGQFPMVLLVPEDIMLTQGSPSGRRAFMDSAFSQISPLYLANILDYQKVLTQRNKLLRQIASGENIAKETLDIWTEQLIEYGTQLTHQRAYYLEQLKPLLKDYYNIFVNDKETLDLFYNASISEIKTNMSIREIKLIYKEKLKEKYKRELERGTTLIGPHRDDIGFTIDDLEIRSYGSQGQHRTLVLSLRLAQAKQTLKEIGEMPLLLLDDVLFELDFDRVERLLEIADSFGQVCLATARESEVVPLLPNAKKFRIESGQCFNIRD